MPKLSAPFQHLHPAALAALVLFAAAPAVLAAPPGPVPSEVSDIAWVQLATGLLGGLAIFLFGMDQMAGGLKSAAGGKMKTILARFTDNRLKAATAGALVTAVIQSSSVTTVLVVGFVSAGLMSLTQSVGVIMGANVGTTVTAQIVAFNVEKAALGIVAVGFAALFIGKRDRVRHFGNTVMGLGLVFLGMGVMSESMHPLRSFDPFIRFMADMQHPALGILVGAAFTALVQSSSATTGIVIALASQGLLPLHAGIALIFGANVGTCFTALLATLGKGRESLRAALVHVIFNVAGVLAWVAFIPFLADLVTSFSSPSDAASATAQLAADVPRQIANAHAIFNISNTLVMLPFAPAIAWLATRLVPAKPSPRPITPQFLDPATIAVPSVALHNARLEIARLCGLVADMLEKVPDATLSESPAALEALAAEDDVIDFLQAEILQHLGQLRKGSLTDQESADFQALMSITDILETVADVIAEEIVDVGFRRLRSGVQTSSKVRDLIGQIHRVLCGALEDAQRVIRDRDPDAAQSVIRRKSDLYRLEQALLDHQEHRFQEEPGDRLNVFRIEMSFLDKQRQIYSLIKRIARTVVPRPAPHSHDPPTTSPAA